MSMVTASIYERMSASERVPASPGECCLSRTTRSVAHVETTLYSAFLKLKLTAQSTHSMGNLPSSLYIL